VALFNHLLKKFQQSISPLASRKRKQISPKYFPAIFEKINESLVSLAYHQANIGLFTALLCASIIFCRLITHEHNANLFIWYGILITTTAIRFILVRIHSRQANPDQHLPIWRHLFISSSILGGFSWGLLSLMIMPQTNNTHQVLILMILAGVSAGGIPFMAGVLEAAVGFLIAALLPLAYYFIFIRQTFDILLVLASLVYLGFLIIQAKKIHDMLKNGLLLQFELHEAKNQLEQTATHDPLTKVANRTLFNKNLQQAITQAKNTNKSIALLYIDLDNFKKVNDNYGHYYGDQILLTFVQRLKNIFKNIDSIARLGGDEFTVLLEGITNLDDIATITDQINKAMLEPVWINNIELNIQPSIGISIYPTHGEDADALLNYADSEMYRIKKARKSATTQLK
jgi:diguanylate cyclase (GGDEF)-like protein